MFSQFLFLFILFLVHIVIRCFTLDISVNICFRRCTYATVYVHASFQQSTNMTMQASVMENMPVGTYVGIVKV